MTQAQTCPNIRIFKLVLNPNQCQYHPCPSTHCILYYAKILGRLLTKIINHIFRKCFHVVLTKKQIFYQLILYYQNCFSYIRVKYALVHFLHTSKNILHHNIQILKNLLNIWRYNIYLKNYIFGKIIIMHSKIIWTWKKIEKMENIQEKYIKSGF